MTIKVRSEVVVYQYPDSGTSGDGKNHLVYVREKILRPGDEIKIAGMAARDVEAKVWTDAKGKIRVIDNETIGVKWGNEDLHIIHAEDGLIFKDGYHTEPEIKEVFTLVDRVRIYGNTRKIMKNIEGTKQIKRKTELLYEPTLPHRSRR